jgi:dTDP-glucose 4,6-dehydratase
MKNIIVTGGAGFIGSNFIKKNIKKYKIINIDNLTYASNIKFLKIISKSKNYKFYKIDIRDTKKIIRIIMCFFKN